MHYPWIEKANGVFKFVLIAQFFISLIIAYFTDTWFEGVIVSILAISVPLFLIAQYPQEAITRHAVGLAVQIMTALHIQQAYGLTEIHFEIFVLIALVGFYRDWKVILTSVGFVAVHHIGFFTAQSMGMNAYIFEEGHLYFYILLIHALFAVSQGALIMYMAHDSYKEGLASLALSSGVEKILAKQGQFNFSIELDSKNEKLRSFNELVTPLRDFVAKTKGVNSTVSGASAEVVALSKQVSLATDQSVEQIKLIAAATDQMTFVNRDVTERASEVNYIVKEAEQQAVVAKSSVEESKEKALLLKSTLSNAASNISELAEMCKQIEDVMGAIKAISDQTNLLALNAAIESARAGDHGRGFAVVASEVRDLAMKTREKADHISDITSSLVSNALGSVSEMNGCVDQAVEAAESSVSTYEAVDKIADNIERIATNMASVAAATQEQAEVSNNIADSAQTLSSASQDLKQNSDSANTKFNSLQNEILSLNIELNRFHV